MYALFFLRQLTKGTQYDTFERICYHILAFPKKNTLALEMLVMRLNNFTCLYVYTYRETVNCQVVLH